MPHKGDLDSGCPSALPSVEFLVGPSLKIASALACLLLGTSLSGCASIFEGTSQKITVVTNPPGATCSFERQGRQIGTIASTPGTANVRKTKYDITIYCEKPGYQRSEYLNHSGTTAVIAANIVADVVLTAGLSSLIDSARGADNKYDSAVNITLLPLQYQPPALTTVPPKAPVTDPNSTTQQPASQR